MRASEMQVAKEGGRREAEAESGEPGNETSHNLRAEEATAEFVRLGEAYAVLSNDVLRSAYDRNGLPSSHHSKQGADGGDGRGRAGASDAKENIDSHVFFTMLFGR